MAAIMTGKGSILGFHDAEGSARSASGSDCLVRFGDTGQTAFARLSKFPDNSNHPPAAFDAAVTWDAGLDLLFRIAGAK